jgi:hypothetical protein
MSLSINPLAKLVSSVAQQVSAAADSAAGAMNGEQFASLKSNVNDTVSKLSGAVGTGLNGFTAAASTFAADAQSALGGVTGAMGGVGNPIQSLVSNAQGALGGITDSVGSISNVASNIGASLDKLGLAGGGLGAGLAKLAGQVSSGAGMLNNLLSMARGKNLPSGAELFSAQGSFVELKTGSENDWRVKINCNFGLFGNAFARLSETGGFVFPYLPNITVSTKANYTQIDPIHNIQPYYAYKNSQVDDIQITGEFSVETELDAEYWIQGTTFFKTATRMFFGTGENVGNPPVICQLNGYGARVFTGVPVIIKSFSVDLKEDVNYLKYTKGTAPTWVPTSSNITIVLAPIYNRTRLRQFSLKDYANGNVVAGAGFV